MRALKRNIRQTLPKMNDNRCATVVRMPARNIAKIGTSPARESLSWFSQKMEQELMDYDSSLSAWETEIALALLDDLDEQVVELRSRLLMAMKGAQPNIRDTVIRKCVEVANLAHMIASSQHPILCHYRKGKPVNPPVRGRQSQSDRMHDMES